MLDLKWMKTAWVAAVAGVFAAGGVATGAEITWERDLEVALEASAKSGKPIFMDIYADWCGPCKMMDSQTFTDSAVQARLDDFIPVKVDADRNTSVAARYGSGAIPTFVMLDAEGLPASTTQGFHPPDAFLKWLDEAAGEVKTLAASKDAVKSNPDDVEAVMELSSSYLRVQQGARAVELLEGIRDEIAAEAWEAERHRYHYMLGLANLMADRFQSGVEVLESVRKQYPDHPRDEAIMQLLYEGKFLAGQAMVEAGRYDEARAAFEALTEQEEHPAVAAEAKRSLRVLELLGSPAPEWAIDGWVQGDAATLSDYKGKVVLMDFFQIICPGCEVARPEIEQLQKKYGDEGLEVVGIAVAFENERAQTPEKIRAYVGAEDFQYPVALDQDATETFAKYKAAGSPWTVLIDREGVVRHAAFFDRDAVEAKVKALVGAEA